MYIKLDENGKITEVSETKFPWLEWTDREVVKDVNGGFIFADTIQDVKAFEKAKANKILAGGKVAKITALKTARDLAEVSPVEYSGNSYDFDANSRSRLDIALKALSVQGDNATIDWTTADNTTSAITAKDITMIFVTAAARSNTLHEQYRIAKEKVDAAKSVEELESITLG